jgi:hypothetical protein
MCGPAIPGFVLHAMENEGTSTAQPAEDFGIVSGEAYNFMATCRPVDGPNVTLSSSAVSPKLPPLSTIIWYPSVDKVETRFTSFTVGVREFTSHGFWSVSRHQQGEAPTVMAGTMVRATPVASFAETPLQRAQSHRTSPATSMPCSSGVEVQYFVRR